ncbi:MAG TPA: helix-turn-helix transcriptional regulator, partial [Pilimelia sp.]|nr:helix-turn-helix transcriptional regulator [Pilimelia sp.]
MPDQATTLAERLDHLFRTVLRPDGRPHSHREVADAISRTDEPISHAYIGQLRSGERDNPTLKHLRGLAAFFGVPVEYFTHAQVATEVDSELKLVTSLRDLRGNDDLQSLVVRTRGISPRSLRSLQS